MSGPDADGRRRGELHADDDDRDDDGGHHGASALTLLVTAANKAYDGTTSATLTSCTVSGSADRRRDRCTGTRRLSTATVGRKTVTVTGLTLTGAEAGNYTLTASSATTTAAITAFSVTPHVTVADKAYDGTTSATLTSCTVSGLVRG